MKSRGENILTRNIESIFILLTLFLILLAFNNLNRTREKNSCSPLFSSLLNKNDGIPSSGLPVLFCGKSMVINPVDMKLLNFHKDPQLDNRLADIKITVSRVMREKLDQSPPPSVTYHLFPAENDELPVLS